MTFQEWFYSAPHRAKYTNDHSAYLAAQEAWEAAHEACAKACEDEIKRVKPIYSVTAENALKAIRARGEKT